jgi:hypothetical protein
MVKPSSKRETKRQLAYIVYLEGLTGLRTRGAVGARIRQLKAEARRRRIPEYKWEPAPVRKYRDPSMTRKRASQRSRSMQRGHPRPVRGSVREEDR